MCTMLTAAACVGGTSLRSQPAPMVIVVTGQSMIRSDLRSTKPDAVATLKGLLRGDVVFTNLEGTIAEPGESAQEGRGFLAPPEALDALTAIGFNLLALADNHAYDLRDAGIRNTLREADRRHIAHAGTGESISAAAEAAYLQTPTGTVALIASASGLMAPGARATTDHAGVNELRVNAGSRENEATADLPDAPGNTPNADDARRILQSIREARTRADVVIVYQHNHVFGNRSFATIFTEGMPERLAPDAWLTKWTHDEIDAGADLIVMHGAPLLHGVEIYRGRPIFYDLGNFIYNLPATLTYIDEPMAWESIVATVRFDAGAGAPSGRARRTLASISLRPIVLNPIGDGQPDAHDPHASNQFLHTRGLPAPAEGERGRYILERVATASKPFRTTIDVDGREASVRVR